jgi:short-subunit dehydrogenase
VARGRDRLATAADELGALAIEADVAAPDAPSRILRALTAIDRPHLDLLVLNAGIPGRGAGQQTAVAEARRTMDTNYLGMVAVTLALWPLVRSGGGCVINVCSVAGLVPVPDAAAYTASKHAAVGWSRSLAVTAPRDGVRVLTVHPGPVATTGFPQTALRRGRLTGRVVITPERCAARIITALERNASEVCIPRWWRVAVVAHAAAPGISSRLAARIASGAQRR